MYFRYTILKETKGFVNNNRLDNSDLNNSIFQTIPIS